MLLTAASAKEAVGVVVIIGQLTISFVYALIVHTLDVAVMVSLFFSFIFLWLPSGSGFFMILGKFS